MSVVKVIIDQSAKDSLEMVNFLRQIGEVDHLGDGVYQVQGHRETVIEVTDMFPKTALQVEVISEIR